jgi:RHS repeat-associated protein
MSLRPAPFFRLPLSCLQDISREQSDFASATHSPVCIKNMQSSTTFVVADYGYRYYAPELGRWTSRDPIRERGGVNILAMSLNNSLNHWDYLGQDGWSDAIDELFAWIIGPSPADNDGSVPFTSYNQNDTHSINMSVSAIAQKLRDGFSQKNQGKPCCKWNDYTNVKLDFGLSELIGDAGNGTAQFVGSARGDAVILDYTDSAIYVKFTLTNTTSMTSGFYRLWPDSLNPTDGMMANWTQTYEWEEEFSCGGL